MSIKQLVFPAIFITLAALAFSVHAQNPIDQSEQPVEAAQSEILIEEQIQPEIMEPPSESKVNPVQIPSLLFTYWEYNAIKDAKRSRGNVRAPTDAELMGGLGLDSEAERMRPPPEERYITLGGIAYTSQSEWTIWLNGQRVTPTAIPNEVIDLVVYKEYIELKWLDDWSNQIFPVRIRPHQRFNVDTRMFLPG